MKSILFRSPAYTLFFLFILSTEIYKWKFNTEPSKEELLKVWYISIKDEGSSFVLKFGNKKFRTIKTMSCNFMPLAQEGKCSAKARLFMFKKAASHLGENPYSLKYDHGTVLVNNIDICDFMFRQLFMSPPQVKLTESDWCLNSTGL